MNKLIYKLIEPLQKIQDWIYYKQHEQEIINILNEERLDEIKWQNEYNNL